MNDGFASITVCFVFYITQATLLTTSCGQAWNVIGAICDISIALSMPYYVRNLTTLATDVFALILLPQLMRHGTGLPSTHVLIVRLVRLLIETGGLTGMCN